MNETTPKRATLILRISAVLTKEQREKIVTGARGQLPADVGLIVLERDFEYELISSAA